MLSMSKHNLCNKTTGSNGSKYFFATKGYKHDKQRTQKTEERQQQIPAPSGTNTSLAGAVVVNKNAKILANTQMRHTYIDNCI